MRPSRWTGSNLRWRPASRPRAGAAPGRPAGAGCGLCPAVPATGVLRRQTCMRFISPGARRLYGLCATRCAKRFPTPPRWRETCSGALAMGLAVARFAIKEKLLALCRISAALPLFPKPHRPKRRPADPHAPVSPQVVAPRHLRASTQRGVITGALRDAPVAGRQPHGGFRAALCQQQAQHAQAFARHR